MKIFLIILFCLTAIGVVLLIYGLLGPWYNDQPLHSAFSFSTAELQSFKFSIQHSDQYTIAVELNNNSGLGDKDTILGDFLSDQHGAIDITWSLFEGDKEILRGSTQEGKIVSRWSGPPRGRAIGYTALKAWHNYTVTIRVNKLMPSWNNLNPKLRVFLFYQYEEQGVYQIFGLIRVH